VLNRLRQTKYIEEILGLIGFLYLLGFAIVTFFLVRFLVSATFTSIVPIKPSKQPLATFQIEMAKKALER